MDLPELALMSVRPGIIFRGRTFGGRRGYLRRNLVLDNGLLLVQVLKRSGIFPRTVHKEPGIILRKKCFLEFAESGHPIFRSTTPLSRCILKSKGHGKLSIHFNADYPTIETGFRILISANQLRIWSSSKIDRGNLIFWWVNQLFSVKSRQKFLCSIKTLHIIKFYGKSTWNESNHFHQKAKWIDSVWKHDFYVLLKCDSIHDQGHCDFRQFRSVACREYTLLRNDPASQPKGWIQGNMRIGPVLEVTTSFQYGKHGIEIRIWSVGQDNSQSWVRISYGTNKYVIDSNHSNTETPADPHEVQTSQST